MGDRRWRDGPDQASRDRGDALSPDARPRWRRPLEAWAALLAVAALYWVGSAILDNVTAQPPPPTRARVEYCWSGSAAGVDLTLSNASGGTEQIDGLANNQCRDLGSLAAGTFLYISAQNTGDRGSVECAIKVDGVAAKEAASSGAYVIATCSGRL